MSTNRLRIIVLTSLISNVLFLLVIVWLTRQYIQSKLVVSKTEAINVGQPIVSNLPNMEECPIYIENIPGASLSGTLSDSLYYSLPEAPDSSLPIGNVHDTSKVFNENISYDNYPPYSQMFDSTQPAKWKVSELDIDGDKINEKIMINHIIMTSGPHVIKILKNNNIIFEFFGSSVSVQQVYNGLPGFYIKYFDNWQVGDGGLIRYVVSDDGFIRPAWQQRICGVAVKYE